jgi:hypothetical protein
MGEVTTQDGLYGEYDISRTNDAVDAYGAAESWYGDGDYPPDWGQRRAAVKERDDYQCRRCRRYVGDVESVHTHHLQHLADGGGNELSNLVTLCGACHALIHPGNDKLDAEPADAPRFPADDAPDPLAFVRREPSRPRTGIDQELTLLDLVTDNYRDLGAFRGRGYRYDIPPKLARNFPERMGGWLAGTNVALDYDQQGLVVTVEHGPSEGPASIYVAAVETERRGERPQRVPVNGVVTRTLPAADEEATVRVDHADGYLERTVDLEDTPYTVVHLTTDEGRTDMAAPWGDPKDDEVPYDPEAFVNDGPGIVAKALSVVLFVGVPLALGLTVGSIAWVPYLLVAGLVALLVTADYGGALP